jgi:hypothetical protein
MEYKNITYKKQGDGRDSWVVETNSGDKFMVFEHPLKPLNISNVDITTLSDEQLEALYYLLEAIKAKLESKGTTRSARAASTDEENKTLTTNSVRKKFAFKDPIPRPKISWIKRLLLAIRLFFARIFARKS